MPTFLDPAVPMDPPPDAEAIRARWRDQIQHNRQQTNHGKLTREQVIAIRGRYDAGAETNARIAATYQIDPSHVSRIGRRVQWAHLPEVA